MQLKHSLIYRIVSWHKYANQNETSLEPGLHPNESHSTEIDDAI